MKTRSFLGFAVLFLFLAAAAAAAPEGLFDWSRAKPVTRDILHAELTLKEPRPLKIHALKVDCRNPHLRFVTTGRAEGWGEAMPDCKKFLIRTRRQRTLDFVAEMRRKGIPVVVAVNASPWVPWEMPYTHKYADHIGLAVSDGEIVCLPQKRPVPVLLQKKDGELEMRTVKPGDPVEDVLWAVSGFDFILRDGKVCANKNPRTEPRTFYGLSKDRKTLYLVTADGRQKGYSEGMALFEGAEYLAHFGASDAINMDGGGSTTMVFCKSSKGKGELVNQPPGKGRPRPTRTVANNLGIYYDAGVRPHTAKKPVRPEAK